MKHTIRTTNSRDTYVIGGLYSVADEKGFGVVKVLAVDQQAVHVRLYNNKFATRPADVQDAALTLGIGHLPLSYRHFRAWEPMLIKVTTVRREELDGYEYWKQGGGVWDLEK